MSPRVRRSSPPSTDPPPGDDTQRRPRTRTSEAERVTMRQLFYVTGISRVTIARALGVSYSTVWTHTRSQDPARDSHTPGDEPTP